MCACVRACGGRAGEMRWETIRLVYTLKAAAQQGGQREGGTPEGEAAAASAMCVCKGVGVRTIRCVRAAAVGGSNDGNGA